ncbi:unnamed protein product [Musa acuminata var. zebrina]
MLATSMQISPFPLNLLLAVARSVYINGEQTNFEIDPAVVVEACDVYPEVNYVTVDDFLTKLVEDMHAAIH